MKVGHGDCIPLFRFAKIERVLGFVFDIDIRCNDIVGRRQPWRDLVGVQEAPVLEMCTPIRQENIQRM